MRGTAPTWISLCSEQLRGHASSAFVEDTLRCFSGPFPRSDQPPPPEPGHGGTWTELEDEQRDAFEVLEHGSWRAEVDPAQAKLFVRRLRAVATLIDSLVEHGVDELVVRVLQVGLRLRMKQIIALGVRPAIRLRALADFYYSRVVLLMYGLHRLDESELRELAAAQLWQPVSGRRGLWFSVYEGREAWGPQRVAAIRVDLGDYRVRVLDLRSRQGRGDALALALEELGAVAGASGGFFLYSEPDIEAPSAQYDPVGLLLSEGRISRPPISRRAALLSCGESVVLERVGLADVEARWRGRVLDLSRAVIRADSDHGPDRLSVAVLGSAFCAVGRSLSVPLNGFVLPWDPQWGELPATGERIEWSRPALSSGGEAVEGISGGPLLLRDGQTCIDYRAEDFWGSAAPLTFSQDETGDRNLLARLAVGTDAEGFLYLVAIDGRQATRALGLSLSGCAAWMQGLGCIHAANMDGGSSKRLMLEGAVLDAPTTEVTRGSGGEARVRPVYSGLAILPR